MKTLKTYHCWLNDGPKTTCIGKSPAQARYNFWKECLSDAFDEGYSYFFKYIKSKYIGEVKPNHFFNDAERFRQMCKKRGIEFAYQGMMVSVDGEKGKIAGSNNSLNLDVLFDGKSFLSNCHPHCNIDYYNSDGSLAKSFKDRH
jgi:hypothetical protein